MSSVDFDGLCAVVSDFCAWDETRFRCKHRFDHTGEHSWERHRSKFQLFGGIRLDAALIQRAVKGSSSAEAILDAFIRSEQ